MSAVESSAVYDPNRPAEDGAMEYADSRPQSGDDNGDGAAVADTYSDPGANDNDLAVSRSGAANLSNPLSEPSSKKGSRANSRADGGGLPPRGESQSHYNGGGGAVTDGNAGSGSLANAQSASGAAPLARGTMMGSMRRTSSANMKGARRSSSISKPQTLGGKRNTLAGMMLSGQFDMKASESGAGGGFGDIGGEVTSVADSQEEEEEYGGTAERLESEQIFMPNMRREAYIPVRIARDKLKQVLGEMAQMKHLHYAALETMERQQEFLKAQLEATVAAYARKLTNDYNGRVKALEAEYQRRLEGLNKTAMGDLQATLEAAQRETKNMENRTLKQMADKDAEIEQERKMFGQKVQMARQAAEEAEREVEGLRRQLGDKDKEIERLSVDLRVAVATGGGGGDSSVEGGGGAGDAALRDKIARLEADLTETQTERDQLLEDRAAFEHAVDERDQEIAQLQDQLASVGQDAEGGEMVVGGDDEEEEEEPEGVVVGGDDDEEEEEQTLVM